MDSNSTTTETPESTTNKLALLRNTEVYIPLIAAVIATYVHFWGYAYLKGKLQMVGLGDIEIELSILESVYQASLSFKDIVNGMINASLSGLIYTMTILFSALILVILMYSIYHYFSGLNLEENNKAPNNVDLPHGFLGSLKNRNDSEFRSVCGHGDHYGVFSGFRRG
ncbi:hypothetical protein [Planctobacterium marinum]|uniref:Uncharacterized protein n=1 Tax=Planctobacterium marinum TaxID=1631968 RepID=A0AA48HLV2_9ALTE|nr:hypothetical protein MACH26_27020 [Planctobacterium marinum]